MKHPENLSTLTEQGLLAFIALDIVVRSGPLTLADDILDDVADDIEDSIASAINLSKAGDDGMEIDWPRRLAKIGRAIAVVQELRRREHATPAGEGTVSQ